MITLAAARALEYIDEGMVVGLGTGRAGEAFLHALAARVRGGLRIQGVPTSTRTADLARSAGVPLTSLDRVNTIDVTVDGADEVDPQLNLIKGYGGALLREKLAAEKSKRLVIVVDESKLVARLGTLGRLPVEVAPFAWRRVQQQLADRQCAATLRSSEDGVFVTDNGNYILDCAVPPIRDPARLDRDIQAISGVIATGLFLGLASMVLVQRGTHVEVRQRDR